MTPKILLLATCRWYSAARLAIAFVGAGCEVEMVCPQDHPAERTSALLKRYAYHALAPLQSFKSAIRLSKPALLVPCDELATLHLHALHAAALKEARLRGAGTEVDKMRLLIERSLGDPAGFPVITARSVIMKIAQEQGMPVPETAIIESLAGLREWLVEHGFPSLLKSDGTSGGLGVRTVLNFEDAAAGFEKLSAPPLVVRAIKRAVMDHDLTLIVPCLLRKRAVVNVQKFVSGREATSAVACWKGRMLASIHVEVLRTCQEKGPASVVKRMESDAIDQAIEKMACRLGLSGLYGFDFILEEGSGIAYLIEINPRATQTCHLALGAGQDLTASLYAVLAGEPAVRARTLTDNPVIALFPQEWQSNPRSQYLRSAYHDVPWEEPELVRMGIADKGQRVHWYSPRKLEQLSTGPVRGR